MTTSLGNMTTSLGAQTQRRIRKRSGGSKVFNSNSSAIRFLGFPSCNRFCQPHPSPGGPKGAVRSDLRPRGVAGEDWGCLGCATAKRCPNQSKTRCFQMRRRCHQLFIWSCLSPTSLFRRRNSWELEDETMEPEIEDVWSCVSGSRWSVSSSGELAKRAELTSSTLFFKHLSGVKLAA